MTHQNHKHHCRKCGNLLLSPRKLGKGDRGPTDGCEVQKLWLAKDGSVIRELLSTVPRATPLTHMVFEADT